MALIPGLSPADRRSAVVEAREILEEVGATPLVERIDAAVAGQQDAPRQHTGGRVEGVRELAGEG